MKQLAGSIFVQPYKEGVVVPGHAIGFDKIDRVRHGGGNGRELDVGDTGTRTVSGPGS